MFIQADIVQVAVVDHPFSHILWFLLSLRQSVDNVVSKAFRFSSLF